MIENILGLGAVRFFFHRIFLKLYSSLNRERQSREFFVDIAFNRIAPLLPLYCPPVDIIKKYLWTRPKVSNQCAVGLFFERMFDGEQ
jgi:hypothetical protein